jgi:hypothetical protein
MRAFTLAFLLAVGLGLGLGFGCGGELPPDQMMMQSQDGGAGDLAHATGSGDMAQSGSGGDMAQSSGLKPFGADCTTNAECATGICDQFQMGAVHKCTQKCELGCPAPSTGGCNGKDECKF